MARMIEVRWHGRGGQGAKTAAQMLAEAAIEEGRHAQAFPEYGPERTGAPVRAYTRISDAPIVLHSPVRHPSVVMVLDQTLLDTVDVVEGMPEDGTLIINTPKAPEDIRKRLNLKGGKIITLNASQIAQETIGRPIPNTVMLGAFLRATGMLELETVVADIQHKFARKFSREISDANVKAIRRAYQEVKIG
ncbi:MAG: 2-oxoacid:acceptor oxidoreductase family protein [candidate division KSB1 bacterium]|nr:2-oxoacid:acceptor oxidoreductase family protein [candidate division KSB1 bacterium]MDZ7294587.1 2-oxoacid:acceptor oxidoreductase family protein [candidate division KSB1 bacterium]MDZ7339359.1 2-oxoacid:acceptor oxidoreductase family protein [candidate division KSB1 bacterium]MDZ7378353.1 2-oxoacid:acceptor oxidoreductase family protein [candidate division KSB1 bacterium]MDZ7385993.1 2-oxoacid:acceptor oxidoreductase family protein [candidate division KSB1 bacterium]